MNGAAALLAERLRRLGSGDGLRAQLVRGGIGSLAVKAAHAGLAFALAVVLARVLGPEGYGVYSFALAVLMTTAIPAQVGVPQLIVRETAKSQTDRSFGLMRGLWRWGNVTVAIFSMGAMLVTAGTLLFTQVGSGGTRAMTLIVGLGLIPLIALANVRGACLRGLRKVVRGQLPESVIRPAMLLLLVVIWTRVISSKGSLLPHHAMGLYVTAAVVAFILGAWLLRYSKPEELAEKPPPVYQMRSWWTAVIPLALIAGLQLLNTYADLIILGTFRTDEEVGIYRAVFQVATLVIFGLQAMNQVVQPHYARLFQRGEQVRLQRLVTINARAVLALALPPSVVFIFFGDELLGWVFGDPFRVGSLALMILSAGQLVNAGFGIVGPLLIMSGFESVAAKGMMISATLNVLLNMVFIPFWGIVGASLATSISLFVWNLLLWNYVRNKLSINSSIWAIH